MLKLRLQLRRTPGQVLPLPRVMLEIEKIMRPENLRCAPPLSS